MAKYIDADAMTTSQRVIRNIMKCPIPPCNPIFIQLISNDNKNNRVKSSFIYLRQNKQSNRISSAIAAQKEDQQQALRNSTLTSYTSLRSFLLGMLVFRK